MPKCVRRTAATASGGPLTSTCAAAWRPKKYRSSSPGAPLTTPPVLAPSLVMRLHRVVGQLEVVAQASGEHQVGEWTEVHRPHHQVAKPDTQPRLCREDREKLLRRGLLAFDEAAQSGLVGVEGPPVIATGASEFAGQHVGLGHRQTGALAGHQGDTGRRVADECRSAPRPAIQADLADDIEVQIIHTVERGQDLRAFPARVTELVAQQGLSSGQLAGIGGLVLSGI